MLREALLMTVLTAMLMALGFLLGLYFGNPIGFAFWALIMSIIMNMVMYLFSDKIVLLMTGARIVSPSEEPRLHRIVERLAAKAGIPKPKVAIVPTNVPNAFATGRNPNNALVAATRGLLEKFTDDEIEAVMGHELSHVIHRDTLIAAIAASIAGAISYLAYIARYAPFMASTSYRERNEAGLIPLILASILMPIAAMIVQMAISREREYKADEGSAKITGKPFSLAKALAKIESIVRRRAGMKANPATSHLWIVNPIRGESLLELFSTHPSTRKRIERLRKIAIEMGASWNDDEIRIPEEKIKPAFIPQETTFAAFSAYEPTLEVKIDKLENYILKLLYEHGEMSVKSIVDTVPARFHVSVSEYDVEEALRRLLLRGFAYVKSSFTITTPFGAYNDMKIALTPKGLKIAKRIKSR